MGSEFASGISCPSPSAGEPGKVLLAYGEGGKLAREFLSERVFGQGRLLSGAEFHDAARLQLLGGPWAFSTDSYIVSPIFFPGGDIGQLAIHGTCNDLVVAGARPRWISLSMILEEGLSLDVVDRILKSVVLAAKNVDVSVVTGDTKVAPRGTIDGVFLTTSGIGELIEPIPLGPRSIQVGDTLIVSGAIGQHGSAVLCARENIPLDPIPASDVGSLLPIAEALRREHVTVRAMRDATRGGIAAVLHEWAKESAHTMLAFEKSLPLSPEVRGTCELLGMDPIFLACEGVMVVAIDSVDTERALSAVRSVPMGEQAAVIGHVEARRSLPVLIEGVVGRRRPLIEPVTAHFPRIC
jgi:hydrogenase expression/formation protein HypE